MLTRLFRFIFGARLPEENPSGTTSAGKVVSADDLSSVSLSGDPRTCADIAPDRHSIDIDSDSDNADTHRDNPSYDDGRRMAGEVFDVAGGGIPLQNTSPLSAIRFRPLSAVDDVTVYDFTCADVTVDDRVRSEAVIEDELETSTPARRSLVSQSRSQSQLQLRSAGDERERNRRQKWAARRERQRVRREQHVRRMSEDIVYLGRGVSGRLADRRSDPDRLRRRGLPVLSTPAELACAMGLTVSELRWLAYHSEAPTCVHYFSFEVPKKSGGMRRLSAPHARLAAAQRWILTEILNRIPVHPAAHGFVTGRSVVSNAAVHVNAAVVINTDLKDFFPSITFARVDGLFRKLGFSPAVATILALLCTESPRQELRFSDIVYHAATGVRSLPQGACTSPAVSNLIANSTDRRMSAMASRLGWKYTRYADDITWSTETLPTPSVGYVLARIRHIVEDEGFELHTDKTRIQRRNCQQSVTGIVVNDRVAVRRETIRRLRAILHNAKRTGLAAQNRNSHPHFESWIHGMIGWVSMVNPDQGQRLRHVFDEIRGTQ